MTITGSDASGLTGTVNLSVLNSQYNTLTITGTTTAGTVSLNNVNSAGDSPLKGVLGISGTGENTFLGNVYLNTLSLSNDGTATLSFSGEESRIGTLNLEKGIKQ